MYSKGEDEGAYGSWRETCEMRDGKKNTLCLSEQRTGGGTGSGRSMSEAA